MPQSICFHEIIVMWSYFLELSQASGHFQVSVAIKLVKNRKAICNLKKCEMYILLKMLFLKKKILI